MIMIVVIVVVFFVGLVTFVPQRWLGQADVAVLDVEVESVDVSDVDETFHGESLVPKYIFRQSQCIQTSVHVVVAHYLGQSVITRWGTHFLPFLAVGRTTSVQDDRRISTEKMNKNSIIRNLITTKKQSQSRRSNYFCLPKIYFVCILKALLL